MAVSLTQSIINVQDQIFQTDAAALRNELRTTDEKTHEAFLKAITDPNWIVGLTLERKKALMDKVMLSAPSCTIPVHMHLWMDFLMPISQGFSEGPPPFNEAYFFDNREHTINLAFLNELSHEPAKESVTEGEKLLWFLKGCFQSPIMDPWKVIQSGIPLEATIHVGNEELDLLDIIVLYSTDCDLLGKVLKLYQEKLSPEAYAERESSFKAKYLKALPERAALLSPLFKTDLTAEEHKAIAFFSKVEFSQSLALLNKASAAFRRNQIAAHPLYFALATAFLGDKNELEARLFGEDKIPLSTYFRRRIPGHLTTFETGFVMLNHVDTARLFLKASEGVDVRINDGDRLFKTYNQEKRANELAHEYRAILDSLNSAEKWKSKSFLGQCHRFMKRSFLHMVYHLRDAQEKSEGDPHKMRDLFYQAKDSEHLKPIYSEGFLSLYWFARNNMYFANSKIIQGKVTAQMEDPFFDPQDYRYQWKVLYTFFSALIRTEGFKGAMDSKDLIWSSWDLSRRFQEG